VRVGGSRRDAADLSALTLPLDPAARDALSALYYVRTLPLAPGTEIEVPINEGGAPMVLHVAVAELETIDFAGQQTRALRIEPRVMRRIERRRPVAMTLWLSDDDRRIPLRLFLEAGFGRVTAELVEYRAGTK
jgi:hypothetical protein